MIYNDLAIGDWVTYTPSSYTQIRPIGKVGRILLDSIVPLYSVMWLSGESSSAYGDTLYKIPTPPDNLVAKWNSVWETECGDQVQFDKIDIVKYGAEIPYKMFGWIAPNGDFYPCAYWEHESAEVEIRKLLGIYTSLSDANWICITQSYSNYGDITQPQIDTIGKLLMAPDANDYNCKLMWTDSMSIDICINDVADSFGIPLLDGDNSLDI